MTEFRKELENPSNEYRSAPFWAWNGKMKKERIQNQIGNMKEQHMGGCFIHSREGLETEYLSDEWMDRVEDAIITMTEKALDVWIYDEDKWPSGMAGGMITRDYPQFRAKALTLQVNEDGTHEFQIETTGDSEWYNGYGPANNLEPESVQKFIELTHRKYLEKIPAVKDGKVRGFFTDEPNVCDFYSTFTKGRPWLPWSDHLEVAFEKNRGYKISEHFEELFFEKDDFAKIRHDYCKTVAEVFGESYFGQISDWLHKNNMLFTGHLIFENDFGYNCRTSGAVMPHYRYFDIPGIDILGEQDQELLTVKQCTSVANQFGKKHVMSETYGCTKWNFGLEGQKWLADWQFIMGVTMRCQHLFMYSIKGLRKRDYPPIFSEQTTWWDKSHILEDYYARFAVCSTYGKVKRDILVLHPQSTAWLYAGGRAEENLSNWDDDMGWMDEHFLKGNAIGTGFQLIVKSLLISHRDCDLGDEMLLEQFGRVEDGKLYIQEAGYRIVLVPKIENIFSTTIKLFIEFIEQGGTVIVFGKIPPYVDGLPSKEAEKLYYHPKTIWYATAKEALNAIKLLPNDFEVVDEFEIEDADILTMYREIPEGSMLICCNHDRVNKHEICIRINGQGAIEKIDLVAGHSEYIPVHYNEQLEKMEFVDNLGAVETAVYILHKGMPWEETSPCFSYIHPHAARPIVAGLDLKTNITRDMPNTFPLDMCRYYHAGVWSEIMPVWKAQKELREKLNMQQIWYNGAPQRYTWADKPHENDGTPVELEFEFTVAEEGVKNLKAVVEELQDYSVFCNGKEIYLQGQILSGEYYLDPAFQMVEIPAEYLKVGKNVLVLQMKYEQRMELEDIYLLGDFEVNRKHELAKEEGQLMMGDWCSQGYPHYGGGMTYHFKTGKLPKTEGRVGLFLQEWEAAVVEVTVNGKHAGDIGWKGQDGIDITDYLKEENEIEIKVITTPRNIFGPFHQKYDACVRSSFKDFRTENGNYTKEYVVRPQGLMKTVVLSLL